jgi:hypothetical protein
MDQLISLLVMVIIFGIIGYGLWLLCTKFSMPQPVFWLVGAILILILLGFLLDRTGLYHFHP